MLGICKMQINMYIFYPPPQKYFNIQTVKCLTEVQKSTPLTEPWANGTHDTSGFFECCPSNEDKKTLESSFTELAKEG